MLHRQKGSVDMHLNGKPSLRINVPQLAFWTSLLKVRRTCEHPRTVTPCPAHKQTSAFCLEFICPLLQPMGVDVVNAYLMNTCRLTG